MVALVNHDLLYLEFSSPEEAKQVQENGSRVFKGDALHLEWWNPSVWCVQKDQAKEAWIRVVGLPLHLWTRDFGKIRRLLWGFLGHG